MFTSDVPAEPEQGATAIQARPGTIIPHTCEGNVGKVMQETRIFIHHTLEKARNSRATSGQSGVLEYCTCLGGWGAWEDLMRVVEVQRQ